MGRPNAYDSQNLVTLKCCGHPPGAGGQDNVFHRVFLVGCVDVGRHLDGVGRRVNLGLHENVVRGDALVIEKHIIDLEGPGVLSRVEQRGHALPAADDLVFVPVAEVDGGRGRSLVPRRVEEGGDLLADEIRVEKLADEVFLTIGVSEREGPNDLLLVELNVALVGLEESKDIDTEDIFRAVRLQLRQDYGIINALTRDRLLLTELGLPDGLKHHRLVVLGDRYLRSRVLIEEFRHNHAMGIRCIDRDFAALEVGADLHGRVEVRVLVRPLVESDLTVC